MKKKTEDNGVSRRVILGGAATAGTAILGGVFSDDIKQLLNPEPNTYMDPETGETGNNTTNTEQNTPENQYPNSGTINPIPSDQNAEWADSPIFQILNGNVDVEVNLEQIRSRHYTWFDKVSSSRAEGGNPVYQEFVERVQARDQEWADNISDKAEEKSGLDLGNTNFNIDKYFQDADLQTRMQESRFLHFWRAFAWAELGGPSSAHAGKKSAVIQELEHQNGYDTFLWSHTMEHGNHGIISAIENPTYNETEFDQQQFYVIETDPAEDLLPKEGGTQNIAKLENTKYIGPQGEKHSLDGDSSSIRGMWPNMIMLRGEMANRTDVETEAARDYQETMLDLSKGSAQKYIDQAAIALDILSNTEAEVTLGNEEISYQV